MAESHIEFARQYVMIISAPNGARKTREDHAALPITPRQLACEAQQLVDQQVAVLHLHVRDRAGIHSLEPDHYREAIKAIRAAVGGELIIQVTSESVGMYDRSQQMGMVRSLRPEAVSLALRELCPDADAEAEAAEFYAFLRRENIWPQHILYDEQDILRFEDLRVRGLFADERPFCLLVLGSYLDERPGTVEELQQKTGVVDFRQFPWAVCCFGRQEQAVMTEVTGLGGHVRLGFENNHELADGTPAENNARLIARFRAALPEPGRIPATAGEVRTHFMN